MLSSVSHSFIYQKSSIIQNMYQIFQRPVIKQSIKNSSSILFLSLFLTVTNDLLIVAVKTRKFNTKNNK